MAKDKTWNKEALTMGGFIKIDAKRVETTALNTKVNREVFDNFKIYCKTLGYPMNVLLETFMKQYAADRFKMKSDEITKWNRNEDCSILNTTFNKEIYVNFKRQCKKNGFFVNSTITAFMEKYATGNLVIEYREIETEENKEN
jgi:type IV secretory pathway ATPase VirB11/archaellum biosynthesis ATPase